VGIRRSAVHFGINDDDDEEDCMTRKGSWIRRWRKESMGSFKRERNKDEPRMAMMP
jgi:hypothetical protein